MIGMNNVIAFINKAMEEKLSIKEEIFCMNSYVIDICKKVGDETTGISFTCIIENDKKPKLEITGFCNNKGRQISEISDLEAAQFKLLFETVKKYREAKMIDEFNSFFYKEEEIRKIKTADDLSDED